MKLSIRNLSMTYPSGKKALDGLNIEMESPNLIGFLGPNGAGKTTLMKLMVSALEPTQGEIRADGRLLKDCEKEMKRRTGYLPQSFGLYDELTVWQFLDYMAALKGLKHAAQDIERVMGQTHLEEMKKARISTLSGGQRQRVGIAQALLGKPEILIFDEPTVGLDPEERIGFRNLFSQAAGDKIVLLSTHIIEDVQSVCNRLLVIDRGKILFDGTAPELIQRAGGHVGIFETDKTVIPEEGFSITARVNTAGGTACRIVAEELPSFASPSEPTLEDAYLYCIKKEAEDL